MCLIHLFKKNMLKNLPYARHCVLHKVTVWREGLSTQTFSNIDEGHVLAVRKLGRQGSSDG